MQRWNSDPLPFDPEAPVARVDLEFEGVQHDGPSFTVLLYLNAGGVDETTGRDEAAGYAASFSVFAHGDCWGESGHCDIETEPVSPFDGRPEHPLTPRNFTVDITEAAARLKKPDGLEVTALAFSSRDAGAADGVLRFDQLTLLTYE